MQSLKFCKGPNGRAFGSHELATGSRRLIVTHAKRKGVSKELRELQQLKEGPVPAAPAPPTAPAAAPSVPSATASPSPPQSPAVAVPSNPISATGPSQPSQPSLAPSSSAGTSASTTSTTSSGGLFDILLVRILLSATAIMAVIGVFYSLVFYGASNAVYIFKDQLAAITKKDFVPYSERRRLEQEVMAKLEAEQAERARLAPAVEGSGPEGAAPAAVQEDGGGSDELLNLLPSGKKK